MWELCIREAAYPLFALAAATGGRDLIARYLLSARPVPICMVRRVGRPRATCGRPGFIAPRIPVPRWLRRLAGTRGLAQGRSRARSGSIWAHRGADHYLRDCGPGHVLVMAPTRSGKGVSVVVPTLLAWPHSALIHDFKGEKWQLTAGARQPWGSSASSSIRPTPTGTSVKYNPLEEVRLRTVHEAEDVQNIVQMIGRSRRQGAQRSTGSRPARRC